jgi:hypothetical protein
MVYNCFYGVKSWGLIWRTSAGRRQDLLRHPGVLIQKAFRVFFTIVIGKVALVDIDQVVGRKVYG